MDEVEPNCAAPSSRCASACRDALDELNRLLVSEPGRCLDAPRMGDALRRRPRSGGGKRSEFGAHHPGARHDPGSGRDALSVLRAWTWRRMHTCISTSRSSR
ncbi:MAG: hypothetical protein M0C28_33325 [Candidatus Moduliflexus flocculans]|nr:hypothetical protein [Candidatus Moduliflexus flocculans]